MAFFESEGSVSLGISCANLSSVRRDEDFVREPRFSRTRGSSLEEAKSPCTILRNSRIYVSEYSYIRKRDYARGLPAYVHLFSAAVARFITLAFFRARCLASLAGWAGWLAILQPASQFSSVTPTPHCVITRTQRTHTSLGGCTGRTHFAYHRAVPCVRACEPASTRMFYLAWTRAEEAPPRKISRRWLSARLYIVRLFLLCLPGCIQRLSEHARLRVS